MIVGKSINARLPYSCISYITSLFISYFGNIVQLVERTTVNREADGSSPSVPVLTPYSQVVKTLGFHPRGKGSIPFRVIAG